MSNGTWVYHATRMGRGSTGLTKSSCGPIARRGAIVVWVAVLGVVLIGFVGLAMDAGVVLLAGSHLQIAADAGSLAGARLVRDPDPNVPRTAAYNIAYENKAMLYETKAPGPIRLDKNAGNAPDGDIVLGRYHRFANPFCVTEPCCKTDAPCFFPEDPKPNAVRVRARRTSTSMDNHVPLVFGAVPLFNVQGIDVTRSATAIIAGGTGGGLITLDPNGACALDIRGDVILDLTSAPGYNGDTALQINSDDSCALCGNGNFEIHAPESNIVGSDPGYCFSGNPTIDTYLNPDSPSIPDPLAYLDAPPNGPDRGEIRLPGAYLPGYYPGGLEIKNDVAVVLAPGVYVLEGAGNQGGFQTNGQASVVALNVMIYLKSGKLDLSGGGVTNITPMTEEMNTNPDYIGVSIFQARDNPEEAEINGNSTMDLDGTFYFPNNQLNVGGTGMSLGTQLIAWRLLLAGNGTFDIQYDGSFPAPGSKIFLVE